MVRNEALLQFFQQIKNIKPESDDELKELEENFIQITISEKLVRKYLEKNDYCSKCKLFKPLEEFSTLKGFCRKCKKESLINYREKSKTVFIDCVCGRTVNKNNYQRHKKSQFHITYENEKH